MTLSSLNEKKWKYLSFALMGILATGVASTSILTMQQADAHMTNSVSHVLQHIFDFIQDIETNTDEIKAKTDNLPDDPASQESVDNLQDTADGIEEKTDNLPSDPASDTTIIEQDKTISVSGIVAGENLFISPTATKENAYDGTATFASSLFPATDLNNDGLLNSGDCDADFSFEVDTDNNGSPDGLLAGSNNELGSFNFSTILSGVDTIWLTTDEVDETDSCAYTVIITLEKTVL